MPKQYKLHVREVFIPIGPSIAYVPLSRGLFALIDIEDAPTAGLVNWSASWSPHAKSFYAVGWFPPRLKKMHRVLMNCAESSPFLDHRNTNTLDNRKNNLRFATRRQNRRNCNSHISTATGHTGVTLVPTGYRVRLFFEGRRINLGTFPSLDMAVQRRREEVLKRHGDFARIAIM
jgi:hypothetical protein